MCVSEEQMGWFSCVSMCIWWCGSLW